MPKGVVASRTVECRACEQEFVTDKAGRASWYCQRPECRERRGARAARERRVTPDPPRAAGPLDADLEIVLRMAEEFGANPRVLREAVQAIARGTGDQRYWYRRLAAASLALAAYVGGHTV